MFDILLLGVEHKYQRHHMLFIPDEKYIIYLSQRKHYAEWVRGEITRFKPQIILDEMNLPEDEPENRLEDTHVPWVYMDIPEHVRKLFKLSKEDREPGEEIIPEIDEPREKHWLLVINSTSTACGINRAVVICGAAHLDTFSQKLKDSGHNVTAVDVRNTDWYDAGWAKKAAPE